MGWRATEAYDDFVAPPAREIEVFGSKPALDDVNVLIDGLSQAGVVTIDGAWIHLDVRNPGAPPQDLMDVSGLLPRTTGFEEPRSVSRR
jgi:hypothetical protein